MRTWADAIVLAGGQSRRMGRPKALLPWRQGSLLQEVVDGLRPLFRDVLVVSRADALLPPIVGARMVYDSVPEAVAPNDGLRGPLLGIATGLAASGAPWCFVAACDMPFLSPGPILAMAQRLDGCDALVLRTGGHVQPLHAFYSCACLPEALALLRRGKAAPMSLLDVVRTRVIDAEELGQGPVELWDVDTPQQYVAALEAASKLSVDGAARPPQPLSRR